MKKRFLIIFTLIIISLSAKVDIIVFSKDRPLQVYAFLESLYKHTINYNKVLVLCYSSNLKFKAGYDIVKNNFSNVEFISQNNKLDFKPKFLKVLNESNSEYICFAVDDIIIKDKIDFGKSSKFIKKYNAYGFYFRLGKGINYSYAANKYFTEPVLKYLEQDLYEWRFANGQVAWAYPNNLDLTMYEKNTILPNLKRLQYNTPNTLEGLWASLQRQVFNKVGLCYETTKMVNIPLNIVQSDCNNRNMDTNEYSPQKLLASFMDGYRININDVFQIKNNSPHVEFKLRIFKQ